jgi:hypothetical protein
MSCSHPSCSNPGHNFCNTTIVNAGKLLFFQILFFLFLKLPPFFFRQCLVENAIATLTLLTLNLGIIRALDINVQSKKNLLLQFPVHLSFLQLLGKGSTRSEAFRRCPKSCRGRCCQHLSSSDKKNVLLPSFTNVHSSRCGDLHRSWIVGRCRRREYLVV